jgi:hypothetical protein
LKQIVVKGAQRMKVAIHLALGSHQFHSQLV